MNIRWEISQTEAGKFITTCEAIIRNVDNGSKMATEQACIEIMSDSLMQVPRDTGALASSGDYRVERRADIGGYRYEGIVGYAGGVSSGLQGSSTMRPGFKEIGRTRGLAGSRLTMLRRQGGFSDPVNPKTGLPVSAYAAVVHEDLDMPHPRGGKAKFLEDPVREYGQANFKRVAESYWRWAITWHSGVGRNFFGREVSMRMPAFTKVNLTAGQAAPHGPRGSGFTV